MKDAPKYYVYAYWKTEDDYEYVEYCYTERTMITKVKRALANGYIVKVKISEYYNKGE